MISLKTHMNTASEQDNIQKSFFNPKTEWRNLRSYDTISIEHTKNVMSIFIMRITVRISYQERGDIQ